MRASAVATRCVAGVLRPSVSIVKTIGDAVMAVSTAPHELIDTMLDLLDAARSEPDPLPEIRVGISAGLAFERAGDWYGDVVNLASRITGVAKPSTVIVTDAVRCMVSDTYRWQPIGRPGLKGIARTPELYRVTAR